MMSVEEMKTIRRDVSSEEFDRRIRLYCKELFELNEHGFFDGLEFIKSGLFEDFIVGDDMRDVIVYSCKGGEGYNYCITVSFDGSVMLRRKITNVFKDARFGDKFVTENGDVLINGRQSDGTYDGSGMGVHFLMGKHKVYYVFDNGEYVKGCASLLDYHVVGRFGE